MSPSSKRKKLSGSTYRKKKKNRADEEKILSKSFAAYLQKKIPEKDGNVNVVSGKFSFSVS